MFISFYNSKGNGKVELVVKIAKRFLRKVIDVGIDLYLVILDY